VAINTFNTKILKKETLTDDTIKLQITAPKEFIFEPGQFITFKINNQGISKYRAYTILEPEPIKGTLDLCIKLIPNGFASEKFMKTKVNDTFEIKGPFSHFPFQKKRKEHYFLCIGVGIVPFYCMLKKHLKLYPNKKFTLIYSVRKRKNLLFDKEFKQMKNIYPNFTYFPTLTREKWKGKTGRVHTHLNGDLKNKIFYLCGLKGFILGTKEHLLKHKVKYENIIT